MAGKIKQEETLEKDLKVLTFDNNHDYTVITLNSDGKDYVEHKHFAEKLVNAKKATYKKGAVLAKVDDTTKVLD